MLLPLGHVFIDHSGRLNVPLVFINDVDKTSPSLFFTAPTSNGVVRSHPRPTPPHPLEMETFQEVADWLVG